MKKHLRLTGLLAAGSLLVFGLGCPPEDDPEPDPDPPEEVQYEVDLAGENQVPSVATPADGTMDVDFEDDTLTVEGTFSNLVAELTEIDGSSAHIHEGAEGEAGPVIYNVDVEADDDNLGGDFSFQQELTDEEIRMFANEELYLNIHSEAYPGGELRAQLDENAPEFATVDDSWGISMTADAHIHDVDTDAEGWAWNVLRNDDSFVASGAAQNLSSEVTEVTLEAAEPGDVGDVVFTFEHEMRRDDDDDADEQAVRFWLTEDLTDAQIDVLNDGNYYLNIYTVDFQDDGELRGQIDDDAGFWENLFGTDQDIEEAPPF